jgi:hypothetical protein
VVGFSTTKQHRQVVRVIVNVQVEFQQMFVNNNNNNNKNNIEENFDIRLILKRVIDKRRLDSGWIFNDETTSTSSEGQSRCSSRISSKVFQQL